MSDGFIQVIGNHSVYEEILTIHCLVYKVPELLTQRRLIKIEVLNMEHGRGREDDGIQTIISREFLFIDVHF